MVLVFPELTLALSCPAVQRIGDTAAEKRQSLKL